MRILLNIAKRDTSVFFDPVSKIHLNRLNPFGFVKELTPSIKRAIVSGSIIDVDNYFNVEISKEVKALNDRVLQNFNITRKTKEEPVQVKDVVESITEEEVEAEKQPKKSTKKKVKE